MAQYKTHSNGSKNTSGGKKTGAKKRRKNDVGRGGGILAFLVVAVGVAITCMGAASMKNPDFDVIEAVKNLFDTGFSKPAVVAFVTPSDSPVSQTDTAVSTTAQIQDTTTTETETTTTTTATTAAVEPVQHNSGGYPEVTTDVQSIKVTGENANMRSGPGKGYSYIAPLVTGETYPVTGCGVADNGIVWFQVETSGRTGYVSGNLVSYEGKLNGAKAYLTFDDGPSENTMKILDILDKYNAKATFFVIYHKNCESKYREIINRGHTIALHSYSHEYSKIYKSKEAFFEDLKKISDHVENVTGVHSMLMRFPGGSSNTVSRKYHKGVMTELAREVESRGYTYFDWDLDSGDASGNGVASSKLINNVKNGLGGKVSAVVLMHDTQAKSTTVEALPQIIEFFQSRGFSLEALTADVNPAHQEINN